MLIYLMSISVNLYNVYICKYIYIWVNINLTDSNYLLNADHFAYAFEKKKTKQFINFFIFTIKQKRGTYINQ